MPHSDNPVYRYHEGTKHHFHRFARSLGYLDWASRPAPFRRFPGSRTVPLHPSPEARIGGYTAGVVGYDALFTRSVAPSDVTGPALGDLLRHALGLSAWKSMGAERWALRVNPSSGNLHPTEAYVIAGALPGLGATAGVYHYAADEHVLEERCAFDSGPLERHLDGGPAVLVGLTSIHWRESWKYGERAFRYCQHDLGHAIGALVFAAAALGWQARLLARWPHAAIASAIGLDRDGDFVEAEREEPGCMLLIGPGIESAPDGPPDALVGAIRGGHWSGAASQLSEDHVQWTFIDEIADATRIDRVRADANAASARSGRDGAPSAVRTPVEPGASADARRLLLQRRSAYAFDATTVLPLEAFIRMLARVADVAGRPFDALWWEPQVHLVLFIHRVETFEPGLYLLARAPGMAERFLGLTRHEFGREVALETPRLIRLAGGDCRAFARRLSCDQDIAADGCFSLGMLADFDEPLAVRGASFYRQLYWECGAIGQLLYLEAEAAGVRATGMGCFYDDGVHEGVGLGGGHVFQSLYHFAVGGPVEDRRMGAEPGYAWERRA